MLIGDEEGTELGTDLGTRASVGFNLLLESLDAADADAIDDTHAVLIQTFLLQAAVGDGLLGGSDGILAIEIHLAGLLAVDAIFLGVEVLHLAGKLRLELLGIEMGNRCSTTHARHQVLPRLIDGVA